MPTLLTVLALFLVFGEIEAKEEIVRAFPPRIECVPPDASSIYGWLTVDAQPEDFRLERNYQPLETDGEPTIDHQTGKFVITLKKPVRAGNGIRLIVGTLVAISEVGGCDGRSMAAKAARVVAPATETGSAPPPPVPAKPAVADTEIDGTVYNPAARMARLATNRADVEVPIAKVGPEREGEIKAPKDTQAKANQRVPVKADTGPASDGVEVLAPAKVAGPAVPPPVLAGKPVAGDTKIRGTVYDPAAKVVRLAINGVDREKPTAEVDAKREFELELKDQPLKANQRVVAKPDAGPASEGVDVAAEQARPKVAEPKEGDRMVTGSAAGFDQVMVTVLDDREGFVEQKQGVVEQAASTFTVGLSRALSESERVDVLGLKGTGDAKTKSDLPTRVIVQPSTYNWGRNRMYFSLGALTSNQDDDFKKFRPYLSLNFDTNWIHHVYCYQFELEMLSFNESDREILGKNEEAIASFKDGKMPQNINDIQDTLSPEGKNILQAERDEWSVYRNRGDLRGRCDHGPFREGKGHIRLNTYAEFRLMNSQSLALNELKAENIKSGKRAASFEFGTYLPINFARTSWSYNGQKQALFLAPIAKGGIESIPKPDSATSDAGYGIFKYMASGIRLGHYVVLPNSQSVAPELVSWVDLTIGKWDRFHNDSIPNRSLMRFEATGRVKVPYTPATLGFSSNTGSGPDEFTFFAGTRFDVGKILSRIAPNLK